MTKHLVPKSFIESSPGPRNLTAYIPTLDGWRAVAILLVLTHHLGTAFFGQERYWSSSPTRFGVIGVPIFFGLSGFLITALLLQEFQFERRISLRSFYLRRCFRILPPLFVYLFALLVLGLIATGIELLSSVFFFRNYVPGFSGGLYTLHLWSLSVEEHFYVLWPVGLCLLCRSRHLLVITAGVAVALGLWRSVDFHFHWVHRIAPLLDTPMRTDLRFDSLMWGCCAGILFQDAGFREAVGRVLRFPVFSLGLLALVCCQTMAIPLASIWSAALIPVLILATAVHPTWRVSGFLEWPLLRGIGRISYSLYLWQQLFLIPMWEPHPLKFAQTAPISVILPFLCAAGSYFWVEQPAIRLGRRVVKRISRKRSAELNRAPAAVEVYER